MKQLKQNKSIFLVGILILSLSAIFFFGSILTMHSSEVRAESMVNEDLEESSERDVLSHSDAFIQTSKETARYLLEQYPECPLLSSSIPESAENGDMISLESFIYDVNAGGNAKQAITDICEENDIDVNTAKIKDLTAEQISEIDRLVFLSSDHPIGE